MKDYPDPHDYFEEHMHQAAEQDSENLLRAELEPTPILIRALTTRFIEQTNEQYQQDILEVRDHNIDLILKRHRRRMNDIKRSGHRLRVWTCPPFALLLSLLAWFSFTHSGGTVMGICYACGAIIFLGMLIGGAIFDRPTSNDK